VTDIVVNGVSPLAALLWQAQRLSAVMRARAASGLRGVRGYWACVFSDISRRLPAMDFKAMSK
jgi:hypothetical protein